MERRNRRPGRAVAITGTSSFFGSNLLTRLCADSGYGLILSLDNVKPDQEHEKIYHEHVDLSDQDASNIIAQHLDSYEIDTVVHLAFFSEPIHRQSWAHEIEAIGTLRVLNACAEIKIRKLIMISTTACYGPRPDNPNYLTEKHPLNGIPDCAFIDDRIEAERLLERYRNENKDAIVTTLRFGPVLGPGISNWVTAYLSLPLPLRLPGHDPLVQLVHENDCLDALMLCVGNDFNGTFNIVGKGVIRLTDLLKIAGRVSIPLPESLARMAVRILWMGQILSLPPSFMAFLRYLCVADADKAATVMGFIPRYSTLDTALSFAESRRTVFFLPGGKKEQ